MPGTSNFQIFNSGLANSQDDATYTADASRTNGLTNGIATTTMHNKLFHQLSIMVYAVAEFIKAKGGAASDTDGAALKTAFESALATMGQKIYMSRVQTMSGGQTNVSIVDDVSGITTSTTEVKYVIRNGLVVPTSQYTFSNPDNKIVFGAGQVASDAVRICFVAV